MAVINVILWIFVIVPVVELIVRCTLAAIYGTEDGFGINITHYGLDGFRHMFYFLLFYGFFYFILWGILLIVAILFTIVTMKCAKKRELLES
ncbi:MAG: hypothetical protein K5739_01780 [Lachnospiraceae bacterium]|nr:hypothetical protein [Lachnospiraceae bacterium]